MKVDSFSSELDPLFRQKRFFELRDNLAKYDGEKSPELLFYRGAVANKFNRMRESIELLQTYLQTANPNGEKLRDCYEILGDNYAKNYQYRLAGEKFGWLIENCADQYSGENKQHLEYLYNVWSAASDVLPQTILFSDDSLICGNRVKSIYPEIPVEVDGKDIDFLFDTGANLSCITVSNAKKLNLQIIDRNISIGTSTDIRVNAKLAVASVMKFGSIELENVIFLLLRDEDLYLKRHEYQINGIVGYPVMQACRRISISSNDQFFIPAEVSQLQDAEQNLCFDDMMPLLNINYKNLPITFVFDTGANKTQFWNKFLEFQKAEIMKTAKLKMTDFGGTGGSKTIPAYIMDEFLISAFGKELRFENPRILSEPFNQWNRNFFGNIGQDFIMQFEKMTIDFDLPCVIFE